MPKKKKKKIKQKVKEGKRRLGQIILTNNII